MAGASLLHTLYLLASTYCVKSEHELHIVGPV